MTTGQRADARRNRARILAVAEEEVAAHGADASLERIARVAGVGSATVRRHFPTRRALLEAVSQSRIEALCDLARDLAEEDDARDALLRWLSEVVAYSAAVRGLAAVLAPEGAGPDSAPVDGCARRLEAAATPLLLRAVRAGAVDESVTFPELMSLIIGIALATEHDPDPSARADRLFRLTVAGLSPRR